MTTRTQGRRAKTRADRTPVGATALAEQADGQALPYPQTKRRMPRRKPKADRVTGARLAIREIAGNLTMTDDAVIAWFVLSPQRWAFRSDSERETLVSDVARNLVNLVDHRVYIRVTNRPYPASVWAQNLDHMTPNPVNTDAWGQHLVAVQKRLNKATLSDKEVYLGVRIGGRNRLDRIASLIRPAQVEREAKALLAQVNYIAEVAAGPGLEGRRATVHEVEWLLHRSLAPGIPAPANLSLSSQAWDADDLHALTDSVQFDATRFGQTVKVTAHRDGKTITRHAAVVVIGRMDDVVVADGGSDPWMQRTDRLPFSTEWSSTFDVISGPDARKAAQSKLRLIRDQQSAYREHGQDDPLALERNAAHARRAEDEMITGNPLVATRTRGWHRIMVTGADEEECLTRVREVQRMYNQHQVDIVHPADQFTLVKSFVPGEPLGSTAYQRRLPVLGMAAALPNVTSQVGDRRGFYIGYTSQTSRRAVMFDPWYAMEVQQTSGFVPIIGGLGAGKSVLLGALAYNSTLSGVYTTVLDPSGPLARLAELPEFAGKAQHVDLLKAKPGTLNPYSVIADPDPTVLTDPDELEEARAYAVAERKELVTDIVRMLLPQAMLKVDGVDDAIATAVRNYGAHRNNNLGGLLAELDKATEDRQAIRVGNYLRDMAELPQARLFFGAAPPVERRDQGPTLLVLTLAGLIMPTTGSDPSTWTTAQRLAVPVLHLATYYATRRIYGRPMGERKMVCFDEFGQLGNWASGQSLSTRIATDSRKWNVAAIVSSQNPEHLLGLNVMNYVSTAFVGRIEDEYSDDEDKSTATKALRLLRVPARKGYEKVLARLSQRSREGAPGPREFVMKDVLNNVEKVRIDLGASPTLLAALDTTAQTVTKSEDTQREVA